MAKDTRDKENYQYFTVAIPKGELIDKLKRDKAKTGQRYTAQVIAIRVADYYELVDRLSSLSSSPRERDVIESRVPTDSVDDLLSAYDEQYRS